MSILSLSFVELAAVHGGCNDNCKPYSITALGISSMVSLVSGISLVAIGSSLCDKDKDCLTGTLVPGSMLIVGGALLSPFIYLFFSNYFRHRRRGF